MIFRVYVYLPEGNWSLVFCWPVDVGGDSLPPRRLPSHSCWPSSRCPYGHCPTNPSDPSAPSVIFSCGKLGSQPTLRWMVGTTMKNAGFTFKKVGFHQGNWDNKCLLRAFFTPFQWSDFTLLSWNSPLIVNQQGLIESRVGFHENLDITKGRTCTVPNGFYIGCSTRF